MLDADPELGRALAGERLARARTEAWAATVELAPGSWDAQEWPPAVRDGIGLLVLEGLLLRHVGVGGRFGAELLAGGDLLRPWQLGDEAASVPRTSRWRVLERTRIALLDLDFTARISTFPELHGELVARAIGRSRELAINIAIVHQPKVEMRLEMLLWHLADRWGTVRRDGVLVPLRLPHALLAELLAATRPTVSAAVGALERRGTAVRTRGGWLLQGPPPGEPNGHAVAA